MRYLSIKNFAKHQHYKDRRPPWIKLHVEVLDDYAFSCLQDASKAHLMLLWVLASKMDNRIPYDLPFLSKKLGTTAPIDVEELVLQGFIELSQDDSRPLASRKQSAMPETEREAEAERETDSPRATAIRRVAARPSWITPYDSAWQAQYDGPMPIEPNLTPLRWLEKKHGPAETLRRWVIYLAVTQAQFASAAKLKSGWGQWAGESVAPTSRGHVLLDLCRRYDLFAYNGDKDGYEAKLKTAALDPRAGPLFRDECRAVKPWSGVDGQNDHFKAQEIERRLARMGAA